MFFLVYLLIPFAMACVAPATTKSPWSFVKFCCFNSLSVSDFVCFNSLLTISSKVWHSNFWRFFVAQLNAGTWKLRRSSWCLIGNRFAMRLIAKVSGYHMCFPFFVKWWKGIKTWDDIEWYFLLPSWHINCFFPASSLQTAIGHCKNCKSSYWL